MQLDDEEVLAKVPRRWVEEIVGWIRFSYSWERQGFILDNARYIGTQLTLNDR